MTDPSPRVPAPLSLLDAADLIAARASQLPPVTAEYASGWNGAVNALRELAHEETP